MSLRFVLTPYRLTRFLLSIISVLLIADLFSITLRWKLGYLSGLSLVPLFDFDQEYNLPSMYSTLAIFACAGLLCYIGVQEKKRGYRYAGRWRSLGFVFLFLGLDEWMSIHEVVGRLVPLVMGNVGFLKAQTYWVLPYGFLLLVFFFYFIGFFQRLPFIIQVRFVVAGLVYVGGAMGIEWVGDRYLQQHGHPDFTYALFYTLEELMEMVGIVLFSHALLGYIATYLPAQPLVLSVHFTPPSEDELPIAKSSLLVTGDIENAGKNELNGTVHAPTNDNLTKQFISNL